MMKFEAQSEWQRLLVGGFAFMTAPFAVHPLDKKRAVEAINLAKDDGVSLDDFVDTARQYLKTAIGFPTDMNEQLARVRKLAGRKLN